ncbi:hypothetical protein PGTUg99_036484 [Puccinia graminis f. sp. tritici]|uniref:Uncharacterized protein n=1 Tax=Puccinia graminis f. sp. tritici TaxID=56615 RepID=A0A5B0SGN3_PUCGR|nr:hypothetical protein PGTUg99_036484 [Puccinia graminis f. sp. tritici]
MQSEVSKEAGSKSFLMTLRSRGFATANPTHRKTLPSLQLAARFPRRHNWLRWDMVHGISQDGKIQQHLVSRNLLLLGKFPAVNDTLEQLSIRSNPRDKKTTAPLRTSGPRIPRRRQAESVNVHTALCLKALLNLST